MTEAFLGRQSTLEKKIARKKKRMTQLGQELCGSLNRGMSLLCIIRYRRPGLTIFFYQYFECEPMRNPRTDLVCVSHDLFTVRCIKHSLKCPVCFAEMWILWTNNHIFKCNDLVVLPKTCRTNGESRPKKISHVRSCIEIVTRQHIIPWFSLTVPYAK